MTWSKRIVSLLACAALAAMLVVLLRAVLRDGGGQVAPISASTNPAPPASHGPTLPILAAGENESAPLPTISSAKLQRVIDDYLRFNVFPPWSRPASASTDHLTNWNRGFSVGQPIARDESGNPIEAELTLDRSFAGPRESLTATVSVWRRREGRSEPIPYEVSGRIEIHQPGERSGDIDPEWKTAGEVTFAPVPLDGRRQATFVPSSYPSLSRAPAEARLIAVVEAATRSFPLILHFQYAQAAALTVLRQGEDRVVDGSLAFELLVEPASAGTLHIVASLLGPDQTQPIAVYQNRLPVRAGAQRVLLSFFGRAIREKHLDGPYYVAALHGYLAPETDPQTWLWWYDTRAFRTRSYRSTDFSDAEWQSPEKEAQLRRYRTLLADLERTGH